MNVWGVIWVSQKCLRWIYWSNFKHSKGKTTGVIYSSISVECLGLRDRTTHERVSLFFSLFSTFFLNLFSIFRVKPLSLFIVVFPVSGTTWPDNVRAYRLWLDWITQFTIFCKETQQVPPILEAEPSPQQRASPPLLFRRSAYVL